MVKIKSVVEGLSTNEGIFDKLADQIARKGIGSKKNEKSIAKDFNSFSKDIQTKVKQLNDEDFKLCEVINNDNIVIGNETAPYVLIPEANMTKNNDGSITRFWAGFDCKTKSDNSIADRENGTYRLYDNVDKFMTDLKSGAIIEDKQ